MAYRMVDDTMTYRIHDLDRINKEVNQFLERYHETWMSTAALIVTWKISNSAGVRKLNDCIRVKSGNIGQQAKFGQRPCFLH